MIKKLTSLLLSILLLVGASACAREESEQQQICDAFNTFSYNPNYVFLTYRQLHVGEKVIDLDDVKHGDKHCHIALLEEHGAYAYVEAGEVEVSYEELSSEQNQESENQEESVENSSSSETEESAEQNQESESQEENYESSEQKFTVQQIDVVYVNYEDLSVTEIASFETVSDIITVEHYDGKLYFRALAPFEDKLLQGYYVFDLEQKTVELIKCSELEDELGFDIENTTDRNRSQKYKIENYNNDLVGLLSGNRVKITDRETEQSRIIEKTILYTTEEGEKILSFGEMDCCGFLEAFEKDGEIYLATMYLTDGVGDVTHVFIVKYNFENHSVEFYTWVKIEGEFPEGIRDMYIA